MSRTPEGVITTIDDVWANSGDRTAPPYAVDGGFPPSMSAPVTHAFILGNTPLVATVNSFAVLTDTSFGKCTIDGVTAEFNPDFTGVTTFDEVASALQASMLAVNLFVVVKYLNATTQFKVESASTGTTSTVDFFIIPAGSPNIATELRTSDAEGATLTQGLGDFPRRTTFNFSLNQVYALSFDVNRFGANLCWDETVTYEIGAVVIADDENRYQALEQNTNINPVQGQSVNTDPIGAANFQGFQVFGNDFLALADDGSVFKSTDGGASFSLQNSGAFTPGADGRGNLAHVYNDFFIVPIGFPTTNFSVSNNEGATYLTADQFFGSISTGAPPPFAELASMDEMRIMAAQSGSNGHQNMSNSSFQASGLAVRNGIDIYIMLFNFDTAMARVINTNHTLNDFDLTDLSLSITYFLENDDFYLIYSQETPPATVGVNVLRYDISNTSLEGAGPLETFNITPPVNNVSTEASLFSEFSMFSENALGTKHIFIRVFTNGASAIGRIDVTNAAESLWDMDILTTTSSNLPPIIDTSVNIIDSHIKVGDFIYFIQNLPPPPVPQGGSPVGILRTNVNSQNGLNYEWEYFNADLDGFKDNDGRTLFVTEDNSIFYFLNGGNNDSFTTDRDVLSVFQSKSQVWRLLNSESVNLESTTQSLTINQDNRNNALDLNVSPVLLDELEALGNLSTSITVPETSDMLIAEIVAANDPLEKIELIYDFTDNQLKITNTGANDVQIWYEISATVNAVPNPFVIIFGAKTDKQTIIPTATGFLTDDGNVDSDLDLIAINDHYSIKGHIIYDNGDITRFEFVECIKLTATFVKLAGGFINE